MTFTDMEEQLGSFTLLSATVPEFPHHLRSELFDAMQRGDEKEFVRLLRRFFWMLACYGLENRYAQMLWVRIVTECFNTPAASGVTSPRSA